MTEGSAATLKAQLDAAAETEVKASWSTSGGTATAGTDYTAQAATTLTFSRGETEKTLTVATTGDEDAEEDETFNVELATVEGGRATVGTGTVPVTIRNREPAREVSVTAPAAVTEGGAANFTVSLSLASASNVIVGYHTVEGTADDSDFTPVAPESWSITFAPGETRKTISVPTTDDDVFENDETFGLNISLLTTGYELATSEATATIRDNETATLSLSGPSELVDEGDAAEFTWTLSRAVPSTVDIWWTVVPWRDHPRADRTHGRDSCVNHQDNVRARGNHEDDHGANHRGHDRGGERAHRRVLFGNRVAAGSRDAGHKLHVRHDPRRRLPDGLRGGPERFGIGRQRLPDRNAEFDPGTRRGPVVRLVGRNGDRRQRLHGSQRNADHTVGQVDRRRQSPGDRRRRRRAGRDADGDAERPEAVGPGVAERCLGDTVTITDNEDAPTLSLELSSSAIPENGGSATVTAALSVASSEEVTVTVSAAPVSPAVAADFTLSTNKALTIAAGSTTSTGTVTLTAVDNDIVAAAKSTDGQRFRQRGARRGGPLVHDAAHPRRRVGHVLAFGTASVSVTEGDRGPGHREPVVRAGESNDCALDVQPTEPRTARTTRRERGRAVEGSN